MRYVDNGGITDARVNLALEEYVLRNFQDDDSYLLFYVNAPAIIIGRNQNTIEEINTDVVAERGIHVVRRMSGGGAVYHDLGNLNFSFIAPYAPDRFNRYDEFTRPVVEVLRELGVPAELSGRNDILADGRKISGNAQFVARGRMFSHGTLLFDANLDDVTAALQVKPGKIESKGVKSVRSRVANISEFLSEPLTLDELRLRILARIFGDDVASATRVPTAAEWADVHALVAKKYGAWSWNYGESPAFNLQRSRRFPAGELDLRFDVHKGHIAGVRIFGDFMGREDVRTLEERLRGVRFAPDSIREALAAASLADYFGGIEPDDVVALFCEA